MKQSENLPFVLVWTIYIYIISNTEDYVYSQVQFQIYIKLLNYLMNHTYRVKQASLHSVMRSDNDSPEQRKNPTMREPARDMVLTDVPEY